jgi:acetolactate synthase I/II/III large subunit
MKRTGAEIVWEMFKREGVEVVFGIPGGAIMHTYHPRQDFGIHHVLMRHEQCAAHAADGYARVSGKVGVAIATSGPGATNLVTGIATAAMDSSPIVCLTGQVQTYLIGTDAFQEVDITGITLPITKHNYLVTDVNDLGDIIHEAFYIAKSGRPGPVLIDLPKDVQMAETDFVAPEDPVSLPGYTPSVAGDAELVRKAARLINAAKRPVILAGHGVLMSGAMTELRAYAEKTNTPVGLTLLGKGGFPESHPLALGMMGMHGEAFVNQAIQEADLILAFGMRFDDRVTGKLAAYSPSAKRIHIDADAAELNKVVTVDVPILGDLKLVLQQLLPQVETTTRETWLNEVASWRAESHRRDILRRPKNGDINASALVAAHFINDIWETTEGQAIIVSDVGQHQMWTAQYYLNDLPHSVVTSGGLGTMGFGLPAAIGAKFGQPEREVWVVAGDGGFQMTMHDLGTIIQEKLPIHIALSNNNHLGMVRQWQEFFYGKRYESTPLVNPDFVKLVEAYGIPSWRAETRSEARQAVEEARKVDGPTFIEFRIVETGEEGNVYPMVPAGAALDEMIRRSHPVTESED